jgi:hypothetical protein
MGNYFDKLLDGLFGVEDIGITTALNRIGTLPPQYPPISLRSDDVLVIVLFLLFGLDPVAILLLFECDPIAWRGDYFGYPRPSKYVISV